MEPPAVVVLLLLALLLGAAFGAWCAWPSPPLSLPPEPPPAPPPAPELAPPPPVPPGLLGRFLLPARAAAAAMHEAPGDPEATAQILAALAADHWSLGVSELRQALIEHSGLQPATSDYLASLAILALEARLAGGSARPR